jgi:hypothetical protein
MGGSARSAAVTGRTGSYSDPRDGFRVVLRAGDALRATLAPLERTTADLDLVLWRPGTPAGQRGSSFARRWLVAASLRPGTDESLSAVAPVGGVYTLEVQGLRSAAPYRLTVERSAA